MELKDLFEEGATLIKENSDEATSNLESSTIVEGLGNLLGDGQGGLDLTTFVSGLSVGSLGEIAGSWLGNGENSPISSAQVTELFGWEKISTFASTLGVSTESASGALSNSLPQMIDKFTSAEESILDTMLGNVGSSSGAMDMLSKMFR
jgi:uncharacterized protein YidB (DUF937 family)